MIRQTRVALITLALILAGAMSGAVSGFVAIQAGVAAYLHSGAPPELIAGASLIGAAFGALVAPTFAWSLLRSVPLGLAIAGISAGAGIGGAVGVLTGASSVNPYVPLALNLPPVPQGSLGALLGSALVAAYLRFRSRRLAARTAPAN